MISVPDNELLDLFPDLKERVEESSKNGKWDVTLLDATITLRQIVLDGAEDDFIIAFATLLLDIAEQAKEKSLVKKIKEPITMQAILEMEHTYRKKVFGQDTLNVELAILEKRGSLTNQILVAIRFIPILIKAVSDSEGDIAILAQAIKGKFKLSIEDLTYILDEMVPEEKEIILKAYTLLDGENVSKES